nr:hypothetical protein [Clostridia bacterium]
MKKTLTFLLALLTLASAAVSCGKANDDTASDTTAADTTASESNSATESTGISDDLPDDLDFDGRTFRILSPLIHKRSDSFHTDLLYFEENAGDVYNDSLLTANKEIEERFGITLKETMMHYEEVNATVTKNTSAGDDAYDIVGLIDRFAFAAAMNGEAISIEDLPYVDLTKPYWPQYLNESLTIGGRQVLAFSDLSMYTYDLSRALLFNPNMIAQFGLDDP